MAGQFEPQMAPFLSGSCGTQVTDPTGLNPSPNIIQIADAWAVRVQWSVAGNFVVLMNPGALWRVRVMLESIGPGLEAQVATATVPVGAPALSHSYNQVLSIAANFPGLVPGAYKLTTVITIENGGLPGEIAAFDEGPVLQFYRFP
jgi:hypothetical protein